MLALCKEDQRCCSEQAVEVAQRNSKDNSKYPYSLIQLEMWKRSDAMLSGIPFKVRGVTKVGLISLIVNI